MEETNKMDATNSFYCKKPDGVYTRVTWQYYYARCPRLNLICSSTSGGYVAATTVCQQALWV
jgi:hypothetical protein